MTHSILGGVGLAGVLRARLESTVDPDTDGSEFQAQNILHQLLDIHKPYNPTVYCSEYTLDEALFMHQNIHTPRMSTAALQIMENSWKQA